MDNLTKAQRSYNMSRIRNKNTKLERKFFQILDECKVHYIKHPPIYGKPDCQINNLLIFVDSDFWHGWRFNKWKHRMPKNYWIDKITRNVARDKKKFTKLRKVGYKIFRIWEHQLNKPDKIISKLFHLVRE